MHIPRRYVVNILSNSARLILVLMLVLPAFSSTGMVQASQVSETNAADAGNTVRISQVYGGGGGSTGYYINDYAELFNSGTTDSDLTGWSLQYGSSTGNFGSSAANDYPFPNGTIIQPGKYLLLQLGAAGSGGITLPTVPDLVYSTGLNMSGSSGKLALVKIATALGCGATATPCSLPNVNIEDLVAYGAANNAEGGISVNNGVALTSQQGGIRKGAGCQDTDVNNDDFNVVSGAELLPRNSSSPATTCSVPNPEMTISKSAPADVDTDEIFTYTLTASNELGAIAHSVMITDSLPSGVTFQSASDGGVLIDTSVVSWTVPSIADGGTAVRTVTVAAPATEATLVNYDYGVLATEWPTFTTGSPVTTVVNEPPVITPIADARAAGAGWTGMIQGNVTVVPGKFAARSFAIQDATGGMYVYPSTNPPTMALGDLVTVQGTISVYHGLQELTSITGVTVVGPGTPPDPLVTTTGSVGATQGKLVKIEGTVTSFSGTTNKTVKINDGSGETTVYIYSITGINTSGIAPGVGMRFTGMSGAYDTPQVNPRYQSDLYIFPPEVTDTDPVDGALDVSLYRPLTATFNHAMNATTITTATFTLDDTAGPISGTVSYDAGSDTAIFNPSSILSENTLYTTTLTTGVKDIFDIALSAAYTWTFTSGLADTTPPSITSHDPASDATSVSLDASVVITFSEELNPATVNPSDFLLVGQYGDVPYQLAYDSAGLTVTLHPDFNLLPTSSYTVTVQRSIEDWAGNPMDGSSTWSFTTMAEPPMNTYLGDLHNHTSYSDGAGTPTQALAAGKAAGLDFMAISDHSYAINDTEWADTLAAVEAATGSDFLALRGFEYTQGAEGHANVYNTVRHAVRTNTGCAYCDFTPNLEPGSTVAGFYQWLATTGRIGLDEAGTVMQFNHPGWINFNDWRYHPEVSDTARLEEVGNGNGTSYDFSEDQYIRSLDYGWKVGATNNADTHTTYWGTNTEHRTGVLMPELTKDALLEALRARRTYASEDRNFSLSMKANGAWMGSEIPNVGFIQFEIVGADPDAELTSLVEIVTDQGEVAAQFEPNSADFSLTPNLSISTGIHYYYIRVTQADGDRIVSSPVWTLGSEDISVTDLLIEPTIPTIFNPSLLTVRVTNRVDITRTVTVTVDVDGALIGQTANLDVPPTGDAFATFSWQPAITGEVTVTAQILDAPAGDNPDDNHSAMNLLVTDEQLPLILIDAGKGNLNAGGSEMQPFIKDLSNHRYNVLKNLDELSAADLNPAVVKLLIITAPEFAYSAQELNNIGDYVAAGGNLWLIGMSDYTGSVAWAGTVAVRENQILAAIETASGSPINMRVNDDEIIDGNDNNGYIFGPRWSIFPSADTTGIGVNVEAITSWSANSLRGLTVTDPLLPTTPGVQTIVQGDLDDGYMNNPPYYDPYHTSNEDADNGNDAYIYNPGWVYPNTVPPDAIPVPMSAAADLPGAAGRVLLYGDSNDGFTSYAYTAGDGLQNELFNLESVMWLMGEPLQKSTIAEVRAQSALNQPDNLDKLVWVEGTITAAYGEFFNVLYVQDETGGITVHAPAGDIDASAYTRGTHVRVVGTVGIYNGDTEIEFFEAEMVQVIDPGTGEPVPLPMSTQQASLEESQGWLSVITGTVTSKVGEDNLFVDDGSGPVRIFLDGYNGNFSDIQVNDLVRVTGLVSEDGDGGRIRVRNHLMHPSYADDVVFLGHMNLYYFPLIGQH